MLTKSPPISIDGQQADPLACPVGFHSGCSAPADDHPARISGFISGEPVQYAGAAARIPGRQWMSSELERETRADRLAYELDMDERAFADRNGR